ncbi:MAG: hypothetical protein EAZ98_09375 [Oscillatoriales cyanobacterium]|uniref:Uncharacterized protein n=1 Tax=Microcoleus anatoxicus PTRS2 TaxID=2705321 RepID=A0ABU8YIQ0_9CYAN|nr:MAG: hypothetical protein EAZ98_09375 [Oscillatoriales cyanobacterium]TAE06644.1 MAG: hypothetical protein EAZ96_01735 [Oscillatoriales cyanobacterium]
MNTDNTGEKILNMEPAFSNLSAEDLENLDVEELEQRLELAAIDYTSSSFFAGPPLPSCKQMKSWIC